MTRYDTARIDTARLNLEACRVKADKLEGEVRAARAAGSEAKAAKAEGHYYAALAARDAAERELDAAEDAPPVLYVEPAEHVTVYAGHAAGAGSAGSVG